MALKKYIKFALTLALFGILITSANAQTLKIYHIDVEQGDATLIISPCGNTMLIASGKNGHGPRLKSAMQEAGVNKIDHFVCTHYHEDHYGGIDELARDANIIIGTSYDRGDKASIPAEKRNGQTYKDYQDTVGYRAVQLTRGETIEFDPDISVTCIAAGGVVPGEEEAVCGDHENDMSIALLIQYEAFRYFIGGDIELTTEAKIANRDLVQDVDIYQADHHGSHTSSCCPFLEDLKPSAIIISNGNHGGFKHTRQHTLNLFANLDPKPTVFQTNKYLKGGVGGNVADEFIADLESTDEDGIILVIVDKNEGDYKISYRDKSHSFPIKQRIVADSIKIKSLLPDPVGSDRILEEITLHNSGSVAVSMAGWTLKDLSGKIWTLVGLGTIQPGQSSTIRRNKMPMSLNNSGDEISLFDPCDQEKDEFKYTGSQEGVLIHTDH